MDMECVTKEYPTSKYYNWHLCRLGGSELGTFSLPALSLQRASFAKGRHSSTAPLHVCLGNNLPNLRKLCNKPGKKKQEEAPSQGEAELDPLDLSPAQRLSVLHFLPCLLHMLLAVLVYLLDGGEQVNGQGRRAPGIWSCKHTNRPRNSRSASHLSLLSSFMLPALVAAAFAL